MIGIELSEEIRIAMKKTDIGGGLDAIARKTIQEAAARLATEALGATQVDTGQLASSARLVRQPPPFQMRTPCPYILHAFGWPSNWRKGV